VCIKDNISNKPKKKKKTTFSFSILKKKKRKGKDIMDSDSWSTCPFCDLPVPSYQLQRYVSSSSSFSLFDINDDDDDDDIKYYDYA
jgi:hypothetical protein